MQLGKLYTSKTEHGGILLYPSLECATYVRAPFDDRAHNASRYWTQMLTVTFKLTSPITHIPADALFVYLGERHNAFWKVLNSDGRVGWIMAGRVAMERGIIFPAVHHTLSPKTTTEQT